MSWRCRGRHVRRQPTFRIEHHRPERVGPEVLPQWWHPQRFGVQFAPAQFRVDLRHVDPDLDCTWTPVDERWLVFQRDPTITHHLCAGWSLKLVCEDARGRYLPLDAWILANLCSRQLWRIDGAGRGYIDRVLAEVERARAITVKDSKNEAFARRRELIRSRRITNLGRGNKFALHHDGTIVPSRGEQNWVRELTRGGDPL